MILLGMLWISLSFAQVEKVPIPKKLHCDGSYQSASCSATLFLNKCQNKIKFYWKPLKAPGKQSWAKKYRNHCSVTWEGEHVIDERKYPPAVCDKIVALFEEGLRDFPDLPEFPEKIKEEELCVKLASLVSDTDAVLAAFEGKSRWAIELDEVNRCVLRDRRKEKRWEVHKLKEIRHIYCPVLREAEHNWIRRFFLMIESQMVIQNPVK